MTELKFKVVDSSGGGFKIDLLERSENDTGVGIASLKKAFSGDYSKRADVPMPAYTFPILEFMYERGILKRKNSELANVSKVTNNYVLIIDEINRGNISSIFGDLITLIESSKRAGQEEALSVELPYSKESFSVPSNLHIIGTMNTADRSLALMDTALRRRFDFIEMMPDLEVLKDVEVNGIDIPKMLEKMNQRIEVLYDREHTLGHAFFIPLKEAAKDKRFDMLQGIFKNKILPLLEEYFFEDWEKIRLVLGDNQKKDKKLAFISMDKINAIDVLFGSNEEAENLGLDEIITYHRNDSALESEKSYIAIYEH
ncbi:MAG: AAA family ATPase [Oleispira sp.]|nr:AAA family ATPase [Oleispira sp.]MBL4880557.1 AAA family ATPase [Oleispira sp.]